MKNGYVLLLLCLSKPAIQRIANCGIKYKLIDKFDEMYDISIQCEKYHFDITPDYVSITCITDVSKRVCLYSDDFNQLLIQ